MRSEGVERVWTFCISLTLWTPGTLSPPAYIYVYMVWINKALFNCISQCAPESVLPALTVVL